MELLRRLSQLQQLPWLSKDVRPYLTFSRIYLWLNYADTLAFPNYTGSPGFGEAFLQELVGRCGELDVQDCMASTKHLISLGISKEGPGMQLITGGSHGGFLTAHRMSLHMNYLRYILIPKITIYSDWPIPHILFCCYYA